MKSLYQGPYLGYHSAKNNAWHWLFGQPQLLLNLSPELSVGAHECDLVADGLDEVVVAGDGAGDHRELAPVVAHQDGEHGGHLVLQAGRQLQLQTLLGLKEAHGSRTRG